MGWTLVTGAAKGLGRAICLALSKKGYDLVIHYNKSLKEAKELQRQCQANGVAAALLQGDFASEKALQTFLKKYKKEFGNTSCLINNVGNYWIGGFQKTTEAQFQELFQTNFFAPVALMQQLLPSIIQFKGSIINIGVVGIEGVRAEVYSPAYTSTKLALASITKSLALELAPKGVKVNMVSPGFMKNSVDLPKDLKELPMQKAVTLEEVAKLIVFLLDKSNQNITGQNIEVGGAVRL